MAILLALLSRTAACPHPHFARARCPRLSCLIEDTDCAVSPPLFSLSSLSLSLPACSPSLRLCLCLSPSTPQPLNTRAFFGGRCRAPDMCSAASLDSVFSTRLSFFPSVPLLSCALSFTHSHANHTPLPPQPPLHPHRSALFTASGRCCCERARQRDWMRTAAYCSCARKAGCVRVAATSR